MSELSERLNKVMNRLEELEITPSELTKDSLLSDLRDLYDAVKNLDVTAVVESVSDTTVEEPKVEEQPEEPEPQAAPVPVAETVQEEIEPEQEKPMIEPAVEVVEAPEAETFEQPMTEVTEAPVAEKKPLIGNEEKAGKSTDEKILAGQLSRKPLEDLRTGIPLNEKFGIIRGLFKGNASDFGDAVLKLNNAVSTTEMKHYLDLLQQRFGWDVESEAYATFSVYVERKMLTLQTSDANADH